METSAFCDALGNPTRYRIIAALRNRSIHSCCDRLEYFENAATVADIIELTGLAQATVSQHLKVLVNAGLLRMEKRDTWSCYFLVMDRIRAGIAALQAELGDPAEGIAAVPQTALVCGPECTPVTGSSQPG